MGETEEKNPQITSFVTPGPLNETRTTYIPKWNGRNPGEVILFSQQSSDM
jgi:hypothetical protein